jgi:hypothetical protein
MSTPAKKLTVYSVDLNNMKKTEMAHFELHGDEVKATYKNKLFEGMLRDGIHIGGKMVKPADGAKFMSALEANYVRSSTIVVERA